MIDLILTSPAEGPATLFTRNFRVHSGIPIGLYESGPRSPAAVVYGDVSEESLREYSDKYNALIAIPSISNDEIPENPRQFETMTVKAPILAKIQDVTRGGFNCFVRLADGGPLVYDGYSGKTPTVLFAADLIKATIRILSGKLEENSGIDRHGRHKPAPESVIFAPAVSFHFNLIENTIRYTFRKLGLPLMSIPRWPESAPLALFLSHDVDVVKKWTYKRIGYEFMHSFADLLRFRKKRFVDTVRSLSDVMNNHDPYWNFDELLFLEDASGFKSTWFFAPFGGVYQKRETSIDPVYHRKPSELSAMIRKIRESGCEVAIHGTRRAFLEERVLTGQLESFENRLGIKICGVRHHYLMFRHGTTLETASKCGLKYDATLGFSDRPGFRNGIAAPFFPFPVPHEAGQMVEIPLNFMDGSFLHAESDPEGMRRRIIESYLYAKAAGGLFSSLIHPRNMDTSEIPELAHFYQSFLPRCKRDGARSMTGIEIAEWWTAREKVLRSMEYFSDTWRVQGVEIPAGMDFSITAPNIKSMRFSIEGAGGSSELDHDSLCIRPSNVDPEKGITFYRKT